jgi:dTDP-4-amino-4,6-dideoxygalactose transaminase
MKLRYPFLELATVNAPFMEEIRRRVDAVVMSGRYIGGTETAELEERIAALSGAKFAIGVSNGLDALRLILRGYIQIGEMQPGDEIIVPANTYVASVLAISDAGLKPVLAEPSAATSNLDLSRLEEYLTPRTRGVMPVHLYGRVCWGAELESFACKHNLKIIEDNAQAIGGSIVTADGKRRYTGGLGDAAGFSFYPTKNIGAMGDAGAVTTSDERLAQAVRALANYGSDYRYHNLYKGFNCRLDPVQAAVLNVKLPFVDRENEYRRGIADIYLNEITNPLITLPQTPADASQMVWHQFVVHTSQRAAFTDYLTANSIGWDMHYATPAHRQPCYSEFQSASLPITDRLADSCVSLPITRCTTPDDAHTIARIINAFNLSSSNDTHIDFH